MAQQKYSHNESLERIYTMLSGGADPSDTPGTLGQTAWDESLSKIAQLLEGSLGDASFTMPTAIPHGYGGIYVSTGTVSQSFAGTTWSKVTGAFTNSMVGTDITADWNDDRILLNTVGTYFVEYKLNLLSSNGGSVSLRARPYYDATAMPAAESATVFSSSGSATVSGFATLTTTSANTALDLRLYPGSAINIEVDTGQFWVHREVT